MIGQTEITEPMLAYWRGVDPDARVCVFTAPSDPPGCVPCPGVVTRAVEDGRTFEVVRVAWKPTDDELGMLLAGGTIWLSTWGGLPPHMLEVQAPDFDGVLRVAHTLSDEQVADLKARWLAGAHEPPTVLPDGPTTDDGEVAG